MKIEKLKFCNINSLAGEFEIDFTDPSLEDAGLFVITGPTGSGKTTLLDAISFALYGATSRQGEITQSRGELISRKEKSCSASVVLQKNGRRYLIGSSQRRKRNLIDVTACSREYHELNAAGETCNSETGKREVERKVEALLGLSFENFQRCMLLAQGEFARFLKAEETDRAEVLSTITQTGIYLQIGEEVQSKVAGLQNELRDQGDLPEVMKPEDRTEKESALHQLESQHAEQNQLVTQLQQQITHKRQTESAVSQLQLAEQERTEAQKAAQEFQENGCASRLAAATRATVVEPVFATLDQTRKQLQEQRGKQEALLQKSAPLEKALAEATAKRTDADKRLSDTETTCNQQIQQLDSNILPKYTALNQQNHICQTAEESARTAYARWHKADTQQSERIKKLEDAQEDLKIAQEHYESVVCHQPLVEIMPLIHARLHDWETAEGAQNLLASAAELQATKQALAGRRTALLQGEDETELPQRLSLLKNLISHLEHQQQWQTKLASAQAKGEAAQQQITELLPVRNAAEEKVTGCREIEKLHSQQADIQDKLDILYREFVNGQRRVCPCCGSDTPGQRQLVTASMLETAQQNTRKAEVALAELDKRIRDIRNSLNRAQAEAEALSNNLNHIKTQMADTLKALDLPRQPEHPELEVAQLEETIEQLKALRKEEQALNQALSLDVLRSALHHVLSDHCNELPAQLEEARLLINGLQDKVKTYQTAEKKLAACINRLEQAKTAAEAAQQTATERKQELETTRQKLDEAKALQKQLRQEFVVLWPHEESPESVRNRLPQDIIAAQNHQSQAAAAQQECVTTLAAHKTALEGIKQHIAQNEDTEKHLQDQLEQLLQEQHFNQIDDFLEARKYLAQQNKLRQQQADLSSKLTAAESKYNERRNLLESLRNSPLTVATSLDNLQQELQAGQQLASQIQDELTTLKATLQFDDEKRQIRAEKEALQANLRAELERWQRLYQILGNSKEGFQRYAQQLTLRKLIVEANKQLALLSDRYILQQDTQSRHKLGLLVIDRYLDLNTPRKCSNLSGGESFIVSLALALGLSHLNGTTRIDTLFLDEGFGTLDRQTLQQVIGSLEQLRTQGKLIGIISHVQMLSDAIPQNICVQPIGSSGYSTLGAHPAVKKGGS